MKPSALLAAALLALGSLFPATAQSTAFTYQGFLTENGGPANGTNDFEFKLYNAASAGAQQGSTVPLGDVGVTNGLFTVPLDFGASVFDGSARWLDIAVRPGTSTGAYTNVSPRQLITTTPYAIRARDATTVEDGSIRNPLFIGTTYDQPLEFFVSNRRVLRMEDNGDGNDGNSIPDGAPNMIGGSAANAVEGGAVGVTIAGGGATNWTGARAPNLASADYAFIGGGFANTVNARAQASAIVGGAMNSVGTNSLYSAIGGGAINEIGSNAFYATIPGGEQNSVGEGARHAFAAGQRAVANHPGTFVWADARNLTFASTASNQFLIRASGGVGIGTGAPQGDLHIRGTGTNGSMVLTPNVSDSQSQILLAENQSATLGMILRYAGNEGANPLHIIPLNAGGVEGAPQFTLERFGGNVGIGTNNPVERLHVIGNILATGTVQGQNLTLAGGVLTLGTTDNQPLQFKVNNEVGLRLEYPTVGSVPNLVGGYSGNSVGAGTEGAVIAGGGGSGGVQNFIGTESDYSAIGGGNNNTIASNSTWATIAGGRDNDIGVNADYSAIGGGVANFIAKNSQYATIAGGIGNDIGAISQYSAIGGGENNTIASNSLYATIAGGANISIGVNSDASAIGGGFDNTIASNLSGATIAGGVNNDISVNSAYSAIGGGRYNSIADNARYAVIAGGSSNSVGTGATNAFAAGYRAKANHLGAFVWGDSSIADVVSTNADSVTFRASGGVRFFSSSDTTAPAPGVFLAPGQSAWSTISDRTAKKDFAPVDNVAVLEKLARMPVQQWHYDWEEASATPHIGPMAQDFKAAFYPGRDDRSITTLEFDGVALAAIQGLNQKVEEREALLRKELQRRDAENAELKQKNSEMETRLNALEKLMKRLSVVQNGGGE